MSEFEYTEMPPQASRIVEGLRDTGYEFNTAIADIIDNSIAAHATKIIVTATNNLNGIRVSVADNGCGMSMEELKNAMRYGANKRNDPHSLGKFGLGLKTASTSCCRRLKVATRDGSNDVNCAVWDLDHIADTGRWDLGFGAPNDKDIDELDQCALGETGTIVVWEKVDRLLSARYSNHNTRAFGKAFENAIEALRFHISLVFQRFLDPNDERATDVSIWLNGKEIVAWDPFCKEIDGPLGEKTFSIYETGQGDSNTLCGAVDVVAYIVPSSQELESDEEKIRVMPSRGGKALKKYSEESLGGFYVYRENRLIHWGDWFGMSVDFHHKLCRFELSFDADLDEAFQVDIKKSRILLNDDLKEKVVEFATPIKNEGSRRYRRKQSDVVSAKSKDIHAESNATLLSSESNLVRPGMVVEAGDDKAKLSNTFGECIVPYNISKHEGPDIALEPVDSLEEGFLWAPALIHGKPGVQLNTSHEFYRRFYGANKNNTAATSAMDYVFYALAQAENNAMGPTAIHNLEELRYSSSRTLRTLAREMPDIATEDFEQDEVD